MGLAPHHGNAMTLAPSRLQDQVAIVTGGASGIGRATAIALAREGVRLAIVDADIDRIRQTEIDIGQSTDPTIGSERPLGMALDVRSESDMEAMVSHTVEHFGRLDILVASAGILRPRGAGMKLMVDITPEEWDEVIDTNLKGVFLSNQKALTAMIPRRTGSIVNLASVSGREGHAYDSAYCASKFAVIGFTESLAEEAKQYNIRVSAVLPDAVSTPMWSQNGPVAAPVSALCPERVAEFIVYMLAMPEDSVLVNPVIAPFHSRRRKASR